MERNAVTFLRVLLGCESMGIIIFPRVPLLAARERSRVEMLLDTSSPSAPAPTNQSVSFPLSSGDSGGGAPAGGRLYLSGCSCCRSGSLIGCVPPEGGPGRTEWASRVRTGRRWELSPCSSSPSPRDGSTGRGGAGPSGCPSSYWRCGSPASCTNRQGQEVRPDV